MFEQSVERVWRLANRMMHAAERPLHTTVVALDSDKRVEAIESGWAGGEPKEKSRGPFFGPSKMLELFNTIGPQDPEVVLTPVKEYPYSAGYKGGVRRLFDFHYLLTACSAWSQDADLLIALVLNYALTHEVRLHHVGFRHSSYRAMQHAASISAALLKTEKVNRPAEDHERIYLRVVDKTAPNGVYWVEHQFFPEGLDTPGIHWDLTTGSGGLLNFVSNHLGISADFWAKELDSPFGMISLTDNDGTELSIMERDRWSAPEDW